MANGSAMKGSVFRLSSHLHHEWSIIELHHFQKALLQQKKAAIDKAKKKEARKKAKEGGS